RHVPVGIVAAEAVPLPQPGVRHLLVRVRVVVDGQADLLEVVLALHACGGLADLLHGGQQQADQDGEDGDDDEQLDQREGTPAAGRTVPHGKAPWRREEDEIVFITPNARPPGGQGKLDWSSPRGLAKLPGGQRARSGGRPQYSSHRPLWSSASSVMM